MTRLSEQDGTIWLETRREGLLGPVGHDLRLEVGRFTVEVSTQRDSVRASVEASTVRVRDALDGDTESPGALGRRDRGRIERTIADEVLRVRQHPLIRFESAAVVAEGEGYRITGALTLRDVTRTITATAHPTESRLVTRFMLRKSDFGIRQVTALLGALRVRDEVAVIVDLPML
jgi:polyisoprenoid-binding protein YceI